MNKQTYEKGRLSTVLRSFPKEPLVTYDHQFTVLRLTWTSTSSETSEPVGGNPRTVGREIVLTTRDLNIDTGQYHLTSHQT